MLRVYFPGVRSNQLERREVGPIARPIPGQEPVAGDGSVGADAEVIATADGGLIMVGWSGKMDAQGTIWYLGP